MSNFIKFQAGLTHGKRGLSPSLSDKNGVPIVRVPSFLPRGILNQEGQPLARGARLKSLRSPRDLTLGGVSKETYLPNCSAVKEEGLDSPKDSSQDERPHDNVSVDNSIAKQSLVTGNESNPDLLPSPEGRITEKSLSKNYDKASIKEEPVSCNEECGNIHPTVIHDVAIKSHSAPEGNSPKILPSTACNFILPNDARNQNEPPATIKKDPCIKDEPLALKEIKTEPLDVEFESMITAPLASKEIKSEPLDVEFESIITVEQNTETKSEILPTVNESPTADLPFTTVNQTVSTEAIQPIQSPDEPEAQLGISTKLPERLHTIQVYGQDCKERLTSHGFLKKQSRKDKSYKCKVCQGIFSNSIFLKKHLEKHSEDMKKYSVMHLGKESYKCNVCQKVLSNPGFLNRHLINHTRIHKCETCKKIFPKKSYLKVHLRTHSGEKPFNCEICQHCFSDSGTFKNHLRIHTGEKPCKCEICPKAFIKPYDLKMHMRVHTGEKPFICKVCKMGFNKNSRLRNHMMIHPREIPAVISGFVNVRIYKSMLHHTAQ